MRKDPHFRLQKEKNIYISNTKFTIQRNNMLDFWFKMTSIPMFKLFKTQKSKAK